MNIKDQINVLTSFQSRLEDLGTDLATQARGGVVLKHLSAALAQLDLVRYELQIIEHKDGIQQTELMKQRNEGTIAGLLTNIEAMEKLLG